MNILSRRLPLVFAVALLAASVLLVGGRADDAKRIHVFVALCDNDSQGIIPVGRKIGDGDKPDANLYWGCSDGLPKHFAKSGKWRLVREDKDVSASILRRAIFRHKATGSVLVADAYRGREIRRCLDHFISAAAGTRATIVELDDKLLSFGGKADLVAYIGHNGLMEHKIEPVTEPDTTSKRDAVVLACVSDGYFRARLEASGARPLLLTRQLMYPGSFSLHEALEGWFRGEGVSQIRARAGRAMGKNQKISAKAGTSIFADLTKPVE